MPDAACNLCARILPRVTGTHTLVSGLTKAFAFLGRCNQFLESRRHLGNIAQRVGRTIRFDPQGESIPADAEAAGLLSRSYREPWSLPRIG